MRCVPLWGLTMGLLCFAGCGDQGASPLPGAADTMRTGPAPSEQTSAFGALPEHEQLSSAVDSMNTFASDLFPRLSNGTVNACYSPASLFLVLAMTYAGAQGDTAREIAEVLHLPEGPPDDSDLHFTFSELSRMLVSKPSDRYEAAIANAVWPLVGSPLNDFFVTLVCEYYRAQVQPLDYGNPETATNTINQWTAEHTNNRIPQLFDRGGLGPDTVLVLTNAVYFKANWRHPFNAAQTSDSAFWVMPDSSVAVAMMRQAHEHRYYENDMLQALDMDYIADYTMTILLPKARDGLSRLESRIEAHLKESLAGMQERHVNVYLPRFRFRIAYDELKDTLVAMGMLLACQAGSADFSGIMGMPGDVWIDRIVQKAFIYVYEQGTEAAAATAVVFGGLSAPGEEAVTFRADHPFLFFIRHKETGAILFLGRVTDPSAGT